MLASTAVWTMVSIMSSMSSSQLTSSSSSSRGGGGGRGGDGDGDGSDRVFHPRPTTTRPPVVFFPPPPPHLSRKYISESPYYSSSSSSFLAPPPPRHLHCLLLTRARKERGMAVSSQRPALAEAGGRPRRRATHPRWSRSSFPRKKKKEERFDVICVFFF